MDSINLMKSMVIVLITLLFKFSVTGGVDDGDELDRSFTLSGEVGLSLPFHSRAVAHHRVKRQTRIALDSYYNGCGKTKGCVPGSCLSKRNCKSLLTWVADRSSDYVQFTIIAKEVKSKNKTDCVPQDGSYVAVAFSFEKDKMHNLLVIQCGKRNDAIYRSLLVEDDYIGIHTTTAGTTGNTSVDSNNIVMETPPTIAIPPLKNESQSDAAGNGVKASPNESPTNIADNGVRRKRNDDPQNEAGSGADQETTGAPTGESSNNDETDGGSNVEAENDTHEDDNDNNDHRAANEKESIKSEKSKSEPKQTKKKTKHTKKKHKKHHQETTPTVDSGAIGRMLPAAEQSDNLVHMGWSSDTEYDLYGDGCDEATDRGKIKACSMKKDDDNNIVCEFELKKRVVVRQEVFSFLEEQHYIHLVSGCDTKDLENTFTKGGNLLNLNDAVQFDRYKQNFAVGFESWYAKWHGTLMIAAWCALIPGGMFFPRYLKESYVNVSCFRYRMWFAGHFVLQLIAYLMCVAGTILILKERSAVGFSWLANAPSATHFKMGVVALLLQSTQVFFGGFRCNGKKLRRGFSFLHLLCGVISYVLSMVIIGLSTNLGMPCSAKIFIPSMVGWYMFCNLILTVHFHLLDKKLGLKISRALYPFPITPVTYDELPGSGLRLRVVILYLVGAIGSSGFLIMIYWQQRPCIKRDDAI